MERFTERDLAVAYLKTDKKVILVSMYLDQNEELNPYLIKLKGILDYAEDKGYEVIISGTATPTPTSGGKRQTEIEGDMNW